MNEKEKMLAGEWYDANFDEALDVERNKAKDLCFELNHTKPSNSEKRNAILTDLLNDKPDNLEILSPFQVDYGYNVFLGNNVFVNHDCYFMDGGKIFIGDNVFIGPSCGLYTAVHPLDFKSRNKGLEKALPITIGNNVWLGGNVVILPEVTIGAGCVIGAGSVVTKDIEANSVACGNPCKIVRKVKLDF